MPHCVQILDPSNISLSRRSLSLVAGPAVLVLDSLTVPTSASLTAAGPTKLRLQDSAGRTVQGLFAVSARLNDSQCPAIYSLPPPPPARVTQAFFYGRPPLSASAQLVLSGFRTVGFIQATNVTVIVVAGGGDCQDLGEGDSVARQPARMLCDAYECWAYPDGSGSIRYKYAAFVLQVPDPQSSIQVL